MITVLMAAYQGRAYLKEQLDSILNQTVPGLAVLISDDGSGDGTWDVIEDYVRRYPGQVHGVRHVKKEGESLNPACANFFWLLAQAEGDYILLSDQDDVWNPDKVECMMDAMAESEAQWGADTPLLLYSDAVVVNCELEEIAPSFFEYQKIDCQRTELSQILVENPVTGAAAMMNGALLTRLRQAPQQCLMHDWWMALTASCFGRIVCIRQPLYRYRQHGRNTLGARETGSVEDIKRRMNQGEQVKENYRQMFAQASCFLEQFGGELTERQVEVLQAFLALPDQGPVGRFKSVCRYHFYKSSRLQTVAQCLTMPGRQAGVERVWREME